MALAPFPTAVIDGKRVFASPTRSGQPRNAWLAVEYRTTSSGEVVGVESFGAATRPAVANKIGRGPWVIVEVAAWDWTPTPARKYPA